MLARWLTKRGRQETILLTERLMLKPPRAEDHVAWANLRRQNKDFLQPWEPLWPRDHMSRSSFRRRMIWSGREERAGRSLTLYLFLRDSEELVGGITLSNIRGAPIRSGKLGYWIAESHARQGLMSEAVEHLTCHAFDTLNLVRVEAACLEKNAASRALLLGCGFGYEGIARAYLEVNGRTRDHMVYARIKEET